MAYGASGTVRIHGLSELNRALSKINKDVAKGMRDALKDAAQPVRAEAEALARNRITYIDARWSEMRIGATTRVVYVAPRARRRGGSPRPTFGTLLMEQAMIPALDLHSLQVTMRVEKLIDDVSDHNGF